MVAMRPLTSVGAVAAVCVAASGGSALGAGEGVIQTNRRIADVPAAFDALTPGRQREYNLYFSDAKQARTREARVEKHARKILDGKGLRDR